MQLIRIAVRSIILTSLNIGNQRIQNRLKLSLRDAIILIVIERCLKSEGNILECLDKRQIGICTHELAFCYIDMQVRLRVVRVILCNSRSFCKHNVATIDDSI